MARAVMLLTSLRKLSGWILVRNKVNPVMSFSSVLRRKFQDGAMYYTSITSFLILSNSFNIQ